MYCFTCGYDVDHAGFQSQCAKAGHTPNVTCNRAHKVWRACMKGQHKTLPDGTGAGMGWILANNIQKATYVIDKNSKHTRNGRRNSAPDREGQLMKSHKLKLNKLVVLKINCTPPLIIATTLR